MDIETLKLIFAQLNLLGAEAKPLAALWLVFAYAPWYLVGLGIAGYVALRLARVAFAPKPLTLSPYADAQILVDVARRLWLYHPDLQIRNGFLDKDKERDARLALSLRVYTDAKELARQLGVEVEV